MENRATKIIELPSGSKAEVVSAWTFDEYLKIEGAEIRIAKSIDISEKTATIDYDAKRVTTLEAMCLAVRKFTDAEGKELPINIATFAELSVMDGIGLREAIDEISTGSKNG